MHLTPNMYKIITLKAHAKEIVTWKCVWHQICTKIITLKTNAKEIITLKCFWSNQSSWKYKPCAEGFNTDLWGFLGDTWENIHF